MTRRLVSWLLCGSMGLAWSAQAVAVELPLRKAGLWEMKLVRTGSPLPEMTMQHCTDATTDKDMATASSPMSKEVCSKRDIQPSASGFVMDSVCSVAGVSMTTHSEITGDFDSAYTIKTTMHNDRAATGLPTRP